eukprot:1141576-Amphidinium_carterae.1
MSSRPIVSNELVQWQEGCAHTHSNLARTRKVQGRKFAFARTRLLQICLVVSNDLGVAGICCPIYFPFSASPMRSRRL